MDSLLQWHLLARALFLLTGSTSALVGPKKAVGFLGRPLSLGCTYEEMYKNYTKAWCQGAYFYLCYIVAKTDGTEAVVKNGRTIITDNHTNFEFTVTLENLTEKDAGRYWFIIERIGADLGFRVTIEVLPATPVSASSDDKGNLPTVNIIHRVTSTGRPQDTVTIEKSIELSSSSFPILDSGSLSYPIYLPILISIGLKLLILLCLGFAMYRKNRQSSNHVASETPS